MADKGFIQGFNGVSYGAEITVTAQDVTDGIVTGRFKDEGAAQYPLAFQISVVDGAATGVNVPLVDAVILTNTNVASGKNGYFSIADGAATFALVAGQVITVIAQPCRIA